MAGAAARSASIKEADFCAHSPGQARSVLVLVVEKLLYLTQTQSPVWISSLFKFDSPAPASASCRRRAELFVGRARPRSASSVGKSRSKPRLAARDERATASFHVSTRLTGACEPSKSRNPLVVCPSQRETLAERQ